MVFPPSSPPSTANNIVQAAGAILGASSTSSNGFIGDSVPGTSGFGVSEFAVPTFIPAVGTRHLISWLVPEGPIIQMYINPQNISYNFRKNIVPVRTKGGYTIQYWGEELGVLNISGTTGTSGYEGINVLYGIYRNEQIQLDPYAVALATQQNQSGPGLFGNTSALTSGSSIGATLLGAAESLLPSGVQQPPTLASMALTVELYWSGEVYRGYFTEFIVKESAEQLGLFNYDINFTVTQKRGFRQNFLAWHRSPVNGPSNSDPLVGTPYSFGSLVAGDQLQPSLPNLISPSSPFSSTIDAFDLF